METLFTCRYIFRFWIRLPHTLRLIALTWDPAWWHPCPLRMCWGRASCPPEILSRKLIQELRPHTLRLTPPDILSRKLIQELRPHTLRLTPPQLTWDPAWWRPCPRRRCWGRASHPCRWRAWRCDGRRPSPRPAPAAWRGGPPRPAGHPPARHTPGTKEGFYLTTHSTHFIYSYMERRKEEFYLMTHSTHFIYSYMERRKEEFYLTTHSTHFIYSYMERRKEEFYLTTHSTHFIYGYMEGRKEMFYLTTHSTHFISLLYGWKEGNVLFNDALNTFYLRLYGRKEGNVLFNDALNTFWLYGVG